jgi:ribonuclease HII
MASIVAKVSRDRIMENEMDKKYPKYNFKKHK